MEDTNSIDQLLTKINDDDVEKLSASFSEPDSDPSRNRRYSETEWSEIQQARIQYLREWEEDMRYAQELASEGM
jgi:hypothetical protein